LEEAADYINGGLTNFCYWNMILNETTKSGWDWNQNSLINIDRTNKTVQYNPDYNAMYILGHFIKPGDVRIASNSKMPMITVKSPDGTIKILIQNTDEKDSPYRLTIENAVKELIIPAKGITAIVLKESM
jgi:glucosylceramidase